MHHHKLFIQMSGGPGSGKSTIANLLAQSIDGVVINHDLIKSFLLENGMLFDQAATLAYGLDWKLAEDLIKQGRSVIIDSVCNYNEALDRGSALAQQYGYDYKYVECRVDDVDLLDQRLQNRVSMRSQRTGVNRPPLDVSGARDSRDYRAVFQRWMEDSSWPASIAIVVDSTRSPEKCRDDILEQIVSPSVLMNPESRIQEPNMPPLKTGTCDTCSTDNVKLRPNPFTTKEQCEDCRNASIIGVSDIKSQFKLKDDDLKDLKMVTEPKPAFLGGADRRWYLVEQVEKRAEEKLKETEAAKKEKEEAKNKSAGSGAANDVKRKREKELDQEQEGTEEEEKVDPPAKRGRGRPRKVIEGLSEEGAKYVAKPKAAKVPAVVDDAKPKRGRGRPRKTVKE
ncbi:hypothetical protein LOCC1_G001811 [Lachnellula occidentalis]|uniref:Uncharacterized protein n=1 Tax=Lachnellula occidentalis TaxID=215460 RepID=A0A8H8S5S5_9HELO|nr:hypothetical protein LOCC1_G001811 [Lachnellula occidentalis]